MIEVFQYSTPAYDVYHALLNSKEEADKYNIENKTHHKLGDTVEIRKFHDHIKVIIID